MNDMTQDMNCSKTVARLKEGSRKTLAILFEYAWSKLRVWLEYGWSMARVWLEAKPSAHVGNKTGLRLILDDILASLRWQASRARATARASRDYGSCPTRFLRPFSSKRAELERRLVATLLLMMVVGVSGVWGQTGTDFSGMYYIANAVGFKSNTPSSNWYLIPACSAFYDNNGYDATGDMPYLTTDQTGKVSNSMWAIKFEKTENEKDYYYIIHVADGQYLTHNTSKTKTDNRLTVHLQSEKDETNSLFFFTGTSKIANTWICSENGKNGNNNLSLNPAGANESGCEASTGSGTQQVVLKSDNTSHYVRGLIGYYGTADASNWRIEEILPVIQHIGNDKIRISLPDDNTATIIYTTDGSTPTYTSETDYIGEKFEGDFSIGSGVCTIKAIAVKNGLKTSVASYNVIGTLGAENPYLLQNVENTNFYMTVGDVSNSNTTVNTSSLPQAGMSWHFEDAGVTDGVQYYYIYNTSAAGYLQRSGDNLYIVGTKTDTDAFKFSITPYYDGETLSGYNIYSKAANKYVYKNSGNGANNAVLLNASNNADYFRWNIIAASGHSFTSLVTASDNSSVTYYTLASSAATDYLISTPSGTSVNVTTLNGTSDSQKWYFKDAGNDGWATYYYIMNAVTGEAMYFNGTAVTTNQANALEMKSLPETPTDGYKFALAPTITSGECYIIPKLLAQYAKTNYTGIWREGTATLQTRTSRADSKIKWQISEAVNYVVPPVIDYDPATDKVTITCTTPGATTIYYTTDGSDPSASSPEYHDEGFTLGAANTVKAIAVKGEGTSNITTRSFINGLYYIKHYNNNYCMYPSTSSGTNGNYVRTTTSRDIDAVWEIRQQNGYYTIKHYNDNKYMWTEDATVMANTVHLATATDSNDDKLLYKFSPVASGVYTISPKNANNADGKNFLDTSQGDNGTHTIGLWNTGNGIRWEFIKIPAQPVITVDDIDVTITNELGSIIYTTDGTDPLNSATATTVSDSHTVTVILNYGPEFTVRAVSQYTDNSSVVHNSEEAVETVQVDVEPPVIHVSGTSVTISSLQIHQEKVTFRYVYAENTNPADPTPTTGTPYEGAVVLTEGKAYNFKAIAYTTENEVNYPSSVRSISINLKDATEISTLEDITDQTGNYYLSSTFSATGTPADGIGASADKPFKGRIDGKSVEISLGNSPLFEYVEDATIKNIIISSASISTSGHAGAIANVATGDSRIYNCGINSGSVSGSNYVGGIVGLLDGSSRVINCYSYADITGGNYVGGIVGYNNVATTATNLKTMVMNCMFYGNISGGNIAPIYNGVIITNDGDDNGVNNFNYFWGGASYVGSINVYNCALMAETRFLQRFEFFRYLLNSNRGLAAWWADATNKDEMMKWVMEPSQIGTTTPYPILKTPGKYPSVVNYTPSETPYDEEHRNEGGKLTSMGTSGKLAVTIRMGSGGEHFGPPSGAGFKSGETGMFDLTITDKDYEHFNFNYGKVQLPYYNDYCDGNYTGNRVVTGWKITSISNGTTGNYSTGADDVTYDTDGNLTATPYNFADRQCTNKDLYSVSKRVFNQGAYWDVPDGVTAIIIEPYWGKAVYLSDAYWDVTYKNSGNDAMVTPVDVPNVGGGQRYENGVSTFNGQTVYTSMSNAIASTALYNGIAEATRKNHSVYDYAVVLVGNYHHTASIEAGEDKPYTVTSVDLDGDNEPDYSFMLRFNSRLNFHPVRYDFLNLIGLGMAQKTTGGTGSYNFGIMQPKYWFEVTNTALFRVTQFEYSPSGRAKKPIILQGGVIEQWVTQQSDAGDAVEYFHVGGNVWFKEFHRGSHQDNPDKSTPHPPVSVTGGDFDKFYLTGLYQSQATIYNDNAECYISGGRFGEVAGAGMEGIGTSTGKGNVTWIIDHADINEFYGGGINATKPVFGNIHTIIKNSHVTQFCGGPKFGDMESGRTVKTVADNCTFGTFFGAGYGGNSYSRFAPKNYSGVTNVNWNNWVAGTSYPTGGDYGGYKLEYNEDRGGVATQLDYQFLPMSGNTNNVARLFIDYVSFSLATTHDVNSSLNGCTINGSFYGGGSLGKVNGDVTSTLTNCTVRGNVFGAGYSVSKPTVEVMPTSGFITEPYYYEESGSFGAGVLPSKEATIQTTTYHWKHKDGDKYIDTTEHELYTSIDLSESNLGSVSGTVTLTLTTSGENGRTVIGTEGNPDTGNVYGGGDASYVNNETDPSAASTTVTLSGNTTVHGDVFGGGNKGLVSGSTTVNIVEH